MIPRPKSHPPALGLEFINSRAIIPEAWYPTETDKVHDNKAKDIHQSQKHNIPFCINPSSCPGVFSRDPIQLTQYPTVTGSSILAITYNDGIIMASDTLLSYIGIKRYKNVQRIHKFGEKCLVAAGGEHSDFDYIRQILNEFELDDFCAEDNIKMTPKQLYSVLTRIMYNRRTDLNPLWNSLIVGGLENGQPFLGYVNLLGVHYTDNHITTGYGSQLAKPVFRMYHRVDMNKEEALELMKSVLKSCFTRDSSTMNKFQLGIVCSEGVEISEPFAVDVKWSYKNYVNPSLAIQGTF